MPRLIKIRLEFSHKPKILKSGNPESEKALSKKYHREKDAIAGRIKVRLIPPIDNIDSIANLRNLVSNGYFSVQRWLKAQVVYRKIEKLEKPVSPRVDFGNFEPYRSH